MSQHPPAIPYEDFLYPKLLDGTFAIGYLTECLNDDDPRVFLLALRDVSEARGVGMTTLAEKTGLNREHLYRTLSKKGTPEWKTLMRLLEALGLRLAVQQAS